MGTAEVVALARRERRPHPGSRVRFVRSGALQGMIVPALSVAYVLATPGGPHRPAMLAVAAAMLALWALLWWCAAALAGSRAATPVGHAVTTLHLLGAALLGLFDGGVAGPAGALLPFSVVVIALRARPRPFAAVAVVGVAAYWVVALLGDRAPPGYALACTLGFGGVSYLCLRHSAALASLRRRLARVSVIDPLTGALNRRGFDERLESEFAEAVRTGGPMTLVLADLDLFKQVNDAHGHQVGDQLLAWLADRLGQEVRAHDAVGRLGGDEFAAMLSDTGPQRAAAVVRRLRERLEGVTPASIGYACFPADGATLAELRRVADARVYADKVARDRRPPSADAVAGACREVARPGEPGRVSGRERRRRSVVDIGWMSMLGSGCGLLYAVVFAGGHPHRLAIGLLAGLMGATGAVLIMAAGGISRSGRARLMIFTSAVVEVAAIGGMTALDGSVTGVCALALLVPVPLIALSSPLRVAVPVAGLFAAVYLVVAGLVGASSGWYVALHLGGTAVVSVVCAAQGRAAAAQRRRLTALTRMDGLTEVLNRRGFEQRCAEELARADRTGQGVSLLVLDLDGFKQVNDRYGHEAGDELLRWVAATLTAQLYPDDVVGRFGGDEFVALLTSSAHGEGRPQPVADRLRAALAVRTGASFGAATIGRDGADFEALYAHADAHLYADKRARCGSPRVA